MHDISLVTKWKEFNKATGGLPVGLTRVVGTTGSGKSTLALNLVKSLDIDTLYVSADCTLESFENKNFKRDNLILICDYDIRIVSKAVKLFISETTNGVVIIDSLLDLQLCEELNLQLECRFGVYARIIRSFVQEITQLAVRKNCALVCIDTIRKDPRHTPFGNTISITEFMADLSIRTSIGSKEEDYKIVATVDKCMNVSSGNTFTIPRNK